MQIPPDQPPKLPPPIPPGDPFATYHAHQAASKVKLAIWAIAISALLYLALGVYVLLFRAETLEIKRSGATILGAFSLLLAGGAAFLCWALAKRRRWSWYVAVVVCAIYVPSLFLLLGIIGLIGLFPRETRRAFGV